MAIVTVVKESSKEGHNAVCLENELDSLQVALGRKSPKYWTLVVQGTSNIKEGDKFPEYVVAQEVSDTPFKEGQEDFNGKYYRTVLKKV